MSTRRNTGELIKRGRIWYVRYYDVKGRRRLETTKSTDRNEAEKQLRKRLSAKDAGVSADAAIGKLTLKEATDDLLNDYKMNNRRSLPEVKRKIELHLLPYFGEKRRMTSITTADMRAFIVERQREEKTDSGKITKRAASNAEINRELAALRRSFRLAVRAGRLVQCPHVPMLREQNVRRGFLEADQIAAICAALPEEVRPVVRFAYATGWRTRSEVLPIEWRQIDWAGRCVRLDAHTTKNGEARSFPFTADLETILKSQLAEHERLKAAGTICRFVFHRNGERILDFRKAWEAACETAGCPGKLIHDMRRSAVRTFERAGVPRSVAMSIVGHKTESIYRRYAIVDEAMQREAAARLNAWTTAGLGIAGKGKVKPFRKRQGQVERDPTGCSMAESVLDHRQCTRFQFASTIQSADELQVQPSLTITRSVRNLERLQEKAEARVEVPSRHALTRRFVHERACRIHAGHSFELRLEEPPLSSVSFVFGLTTFVSGLSPRHSQLPPSERLGLAGPGIEPGRPFRASEF